MKIKKGYCVLCGTRFMQQGSRAFRCSSCRDTNAAKLELKKRFCFSCGIEFEPKEKNVHFCSTTCKNEGSKRKIREKTPYEARARISKDAWEKEKLSYGQYVAKYNL